MRQRQMKVCPCHRGLHTRRRFTLQVRERRYSLTFLVCLLPALGLLSTGDCARWQKRHRERVVLSEQTGEVNPRVDSMEFDPVIAELEQEEDDKQWMDNYKRTKEMWTNQEEPHFHLSESMIDSSVEGGGIEELMGELEVVFEEAGFEDDVEDLQQRELISEQFLSEDHFNITDRIIRLFPLIDITPADSKLSLDELVNWHLDLGKKASMHRSRREMEVGDLDQDGSTTLEEVLYGLGVADPSDESNAEVREHYIERFHLADLNNDSVLNITEYNDFLHPEESNNEGLHHSLLLEEMRHRDMDNDGKINADEFEMTTHQDLQHLSQGYVEPSDMLQAHFEPGQHQDHEKAAADAEARLKGSFNGIDSNGDGFIDAEEFRPMMKHLWPSQRDFAVSHSKDVIHLADTSEDGHLTLEEMLAHPHAFYRTVEEHEHPTVHDEF